MHAQCQHHSLCQVGFRSQSNLYSTGGSLGPNSPNTELPLTNALLVVQEAHKAATVTRAPVSVSVSESCCNLGAEMHAQEVPSRSGLHGDEVLPSPPAT